MAQDLMTYLEGRESAGFEPHPYYSPDGDFLTFFFRDDDHYAERVDELLTVYLSMKDGELVGCKIKGVRRILDTLDKFGVEIEDGGLLLSFLFLSGALLSGALSQNDQRVKWYEESSSRARGLRISPEELVPC